MEVAVHLFFWTSVYLLYIYVFGYNSGNGNYTRVFSSFLMPITMASCYVFTNYLIPRYLILKRYSYFLLYSIYTFVLTAFAAILSVFYALIFILDLKMAELPVAKSLPFVLITVYLVVFVAGGVSLLRHYYSSSTKNDSLKTKVLEAQLKLKEQELKYLKMQIHPHFLFNTLNTLYGFALTKADETPDMILRLSNLLDYLLYQADKPLVSLSTEMEHIQDYIELEQIRFNDSLDVNVKVTELPRDIQIAPMLLIPFVENAFKHGGRSLENKLMVRMTLAYSDSKVFFEISNSVSTHGPDEEGEGIGLKNIEKRLEMLYPNKHDLEIFREQRSFKVKLMIDTYE